MGHGGRWGGKLGNRGVVGEDPFVLYCCRAGGGGGVSGLEDLEYIELSHCGRAHCRQQCQITQEDNVETRRHPLVPPTAKLNFWCGGIASWGGSMATGWVIASPGRLRWLSARSGQRRRRVARHFPTRHIMQIGDADAHTKDW